MRVSGFSVNLISKKLNVSKSSVSLWVRDVRVGDSLLIKLKNSVKDPDVVRRRTETRLANELSKRNLIIDKSSAEVGKISDRELWLLGSILYWAEGGKTQRGLVRFTNSDPEMIKIMMCFFRKICKVPETKFRCYLHIYSHLNKRQSEKY